MVRDAAPSQIQICLSSSGTSIWRSPSFSHSGWSNPTRGIARLSRREKSGRSKATKAAGGRTTHSLAPAFAVATGSARPATVSITSRIPVFTSTPP